VRLQACARSAASRSPTQSIPPHSASPSPKQTAPPGPKNEKQIKLCGRRPEKAAADSLRPYQWPCQPDDTVHTQLHVPDTTHTRIGWIRLTVVSLSAASVKLLTELLSVVQIEYVYKTDYFIDQWSCVIRRTKQKAKITETFDHE